MGLKFLSLTFTLAFLFSQSHLVGAQNGAQNGDNTFHFIEGQIYGGLALEISMHFDKDVITGYSKYGSDGKLEFRLEGERNDEGYTIYELDQNNALSGILEMDKDFQNCVWNSIDYNINLPISLKDKDREETTTMDYVTYQSYIVISYPLQKGPFEKKISNEISETIKDIVEEYNTINGNQNSMIPGQRFKKRSIGINRIALNSNDLLSGHISIYDNQKAEVITITYSYDKDRKEMLDLSKIFKKNFNYSFFLKQYINQKKDSMKSLISPLESTWLKASKFHYYVLTHSGLKFFNDYNTIFGRKSFVIPYHEISSSIGHKSITNYIKKRK